MGEDAPAPLNEHVRRQMRKMPRSDTGVELALRRLLHRRGLRFRVNYRGLPGTPDIAFTRARIAVFVDGCFWHRCAEHGTAPKNNAAWWAAKLDANVERDRRKDRDLIAMGWLPIHVWEHQDPQEAASDIYEKWMERVSSSAGQNRYDTPS
ncbi:very short patch repair endonuclease [Mycobacterium sp. EPG1]|nr:very short patch repair endonuclease [Mycobacterium sp. EPG1]